VLLKNCDMERIISWLILLGLVVLLYLHIGHQIVRYTYLIEVREKLLLKLQSEYDSLRAEYEHLISPTSIQRWATIHNFRTPHVDERSYIVITDTDGD